MFLFDKGECIGFVTLCFWFYSSAPSFGSIPPWAAESSFPRCFFILGVDFIGDKWTAVFFLPLPLPLPFFVCGFSCQLFFFPFFGVRLYPHYPWSWRGDGSFLSGMICSIIWIYPFESGWTFVPPLFVLLRCRLCLWYLKRHVVLALALALALAVIWLRFYLPTFLFPFLRRSTIPTAPLHRNFLLFLEISKATDTKQASSR